MNSHERVDSGKRLFIELGSQMLVSSVKDDLFIQGELVGMHVNGYVIVRIINNKRNLQELLGHSVLIKYPVFTELYGFEAKIMQAIHEPDTLIFVGYPTEIRSFNIRKHQRIDCYLPVHANIESMIVEAEIINMSLDGCLCRISGVDIKNIESIESISFAMMNPVTKQAFNIDCLVRSSQKKDKSIEFGLRFISQDEYFHSNLEALIPKIKQCMF